MMWCTDRRQRIVRSLRLRFVVAVKDDRCSERHVPAAQGRSGELAAGRDVEHHPFFGGESCHCFAQERFRRVHRRRRARMRQRPLGSFAPEGDLRRRRRSASRTPPASSSKSIPPTH